MRNLVAIISVLLCFTLYHQVDGLKCYVCAGDCSDPKEFECTATSSTPQDWLCQATSTTSGDNTVETKTCQLNTQAVKDACKVLDDTDTDAVENSCYTCDTDLCNSAEIYSISALLLASLLFILVKM